MITKFTFHKKVLRSKQKHTETKIFLEDISKRLSKRMKSWTQTTRKTEERNFSEITCATRKIMYCKTKNKIFVLFHVQNEKFREKNTIMCFIFHPLKQPDPILPHLRRLAVFNFQEKTKFLSTLLDFPFDFLHGSI